MHPSGAGVAEARQIAEVTANQQYALSADMRDSDNGVTWGYLQVFDADTHALIGQAGAHSGTFQPVSFLFTATSDQVEIVLHAYKQQSGTIYFDNVILQ